MAAGSSAVSLGSSCVISAALAGAIYRRWKSLASPTAAPGESSAGAGGRIGHFSDRTCILHPY